MAVTMWQSALLVASGLCQPGVGCTAMGVGCSTASGSTTGLASLAFDDAGRCDRNSLGRSGGHTMTRALLRQRLATTRWPRWQAYTGKSGSTLLSHPLLLQLKDVDEVEHIGMSSSYLLADRQ
uniref:Secreted protein n=1 Tax=Oryza glumipatula TaxID=40148 RepID=A0A0D9YQE0_9ORYZ